MEISLHQEWRNTNCIFRLWQKLRWKSRDIGSIGV